MTDARRRSAARSPCTSRRRTRSRVDASGVDPATIERESAILRDKNAGKPDHVLQKIVESGLKSYYKEVTLLEQAFVHDPSKTVAQVLKEAEAKAGAPVRAQGLRPLRARRGHREGRRRRTSRPRSPRRPGSKPNGMTSVIPEAAAATLPPFSDCERRGLDGRRSRRDEAVPARAGEAVGRGPHGPRRLLARPADPVRARRGHRGDARKAGFEIARRHRRRQHHPRRAHERRRAGSTAPPPIPWACWRR